MPVFEQSSQPSAAGRGVSFIQLQPPAELTRYLPRRANRRPYRGHRSGPAPPTKRCRRVRHKRPGNQSSIEKRPRLATWSFFMADQLARQRRNAVRLSRFAPSRASHKDGKCTSGPWEARPRGECELRVGPKITEALRAVIVLRERFTASGVASGLPTGRHAPAPRHADNACELLLRLRHTRHEP